MPENRTATIWVTLVWLQQRDSAPFRGLETTRRPHQDSRGRGSFSAIPSLFSPCGVSLKPVVAPLVRSGVDVHARVLVQRHRRPGVTRPRLRLNRVYPLRDPQRDTTVAKVMRVVVGNAGVTAGARHVVAHV